jgi:hypothetical protein
MLNVESKNVVANLSARHIVPPRTKGDRLLERAMSDKHSPGKDAAPWEWHETPAALPPSRLRWSGTLVVVVCFAVGVATFAYAGAVIGFEAGVALAGGMDHVSASPPGTGSFFDPIIAVARFAAGYGIGVLAGTLIGVGVMSAVCRYLLIPQLRSARSFSLTIVLPEPLCL